MIQGFLGYIYSAVGGAVVAAALAFGASSVYYGAQLEAKDAKIASIQAENERDIAAQVAEVSLRASKWQDRQFEVISELRTSLETVTNVGAKKVQDLEKTLTALRTDVRNGRVLIDRQAKALAVARANEAPRISGPPAAENPNPVGALSAETSEALLDLIEEAELIRVSLIEQREYALKCKSAHSNLVAISNALLFEGVDQDIP